jgi:DNA invertase Pin-like site-specific DNA recombinase
MKATKAVLYVRVSTNGQKQSPEMQLRELRQYVELRGWSVTG